MSDTLNEVLNKPEVLESYALMDEVNKTSRQWEVDTGINPLYIYCSRTGRKIGCIDQALLHSSLTSIESKDLEEIMDELTMRTILSMRPSPDLIYLNKDSMKALINHDPIAACIFFLNKAFESSQQQFKKISPLHKSSKHKHQYDSSCIDEKVKWNRGLIELYSRISIDIPMRNIKRFTLLLLEIDARLGLHKINPPSDLWGFDLLTSNESFKQFMKLIRYYNKELEKIEKRAANWANDINTLSFQTFMDASIPKKKKVSKKKREADRKINNMKRQLSAILDNKVTMEQILADSKPTFDSARSIKKPTGIKLNLASLKPKGNSDED